jgi:hypothetical protein
MLKHVPTEIIGAYLAVGGVLSTVGESLLTPVQWVNFGMFLTATPLWLIYVSQVKSVWQNVLSTLAFIVWVMTMPGGPFSFVPAPIASASVMLFSAVLAPLVASIFASKDTPVANPRPVRG